MELNMKHSICKISGTVTLVPESDADRQLLFHLMDCSDLSQFTNYLETFDNNIHNQFTVDLGVSADELIGYPAPCDPYDGGVKIWTNPLPYRSNPKLQEMIGFNRDSNGQFIRCSG